MIHVVWTILTNANLLIIHWSHIYNLYKYPDIYLIISKYCRGVTEPSKLIWEHQQNKVLVMQEKPNYLTLFYFGYCEVCVLSRENVMLSIWIHRRPPCTQTSILPTIPLDYHIPSSYCCCHRKPFHPPWSSEEVLRCVNSSHIVFEMVQRFGWKVWFWYKSDHGLLSEKKECVCERSTCIFLITKLLKWSEILSAVLS